MRALALAALFALVACSPPNYAVTIRLPSSDLLMRTTSVDVFVLHACPADPLTAATPTDFVSAQTIYGTTGNAPLGDVAPGTIAVFARARGSNCQVLAAGCDSFTLQADHQGALEVPLTALASPGPACDASATCTRGACPLPTPASDAGHD
jgi:hypothetical protein